MGLSFAARTELVAPDKPLRYGTTGRGVVSIRILKPHRPSDVLARRRKVVCPVCSLDPDRPVMIEDGEEWELHQRKKSHRRLARGGSSYQESLEQCQGYVSMA